jgi:hypothetical protein
MIYLKQYTTNLLDVYKNPYEKRQPTLCMSCNAVDNRYLKIVKIRTLDVPLDCSFLETTNPILEYSDHENYSAKFRPPRNIQTPTPNLEHSDPQLLSWNIQTIPLPWNIQTNNPYHGTFRPTTPTMEHSDQQLLPWDIQTIYPTLEHSENSLRKIITPEHDSCQKTCLMMTIINTLAVLRAAPYPVEIPHPSRHTLSSGADGFTCQIITQFHIFLKI